MSTLLILTFSIFEVGEILDFACSGFVRFGILSNRDFVQCKIFFVRDFVKYGILSTSVFCPHRDFVQFGILSTLGFCHHRDFVRKRICLLLFILNRINEHIYTQVSVGSLLLVNPSKGTPAPSEWYSTNKEGSHCPPVYHTRWTL